MLDVEKLAEATAELIAEHVAAAIEPLQARIAELEVRDLPVPTIDAEMIRQAVLDAVAALPPARDGKDVDPAEIEAMVRAAADAIPAPKDGASVTIDELRPVIEEQVAKAVSAIPAAKDGVGLAGALIDRAGELVVTLTNGEARSLGPVVGRDADMDAAMSALRDAVAAIPAPTNGEDGLGFDDLQIEQQGERSFVFRLARGDQVKEWTFAMPVVIDRGVFVAERSYEAGDAVSWAGSLWIARAATSDKPGDGDGWRLAVKKGRDGKSASAR